MGLAKPVAMAIAGLLLFVAGVAVSFRLIIEPMLRRVAEFWNLILSPLVPRGSIEVTNHLLGGVLLVVGMYLLLKGTRRFFRRIAESLNPNVKTSGVVSTYVKRQQLEMGPKIVALGGGTGLSTLLRGLKRHSSNITAIVTVTDDGGSSGRLVQELGIIPPGDIRNCLVALAEAEKRMTDIFQHRFKSASGSLSGHSVGNLFLAGLIEQSNFDVEKALEVASEVLAIRGRVVPSTMTPVRLRAVMENGDEIQGETSIVMSKLQIRRIFIEPAIAQPYAEALDAIADADLIVMGPGSVYTSVIPNLLVPGIAEAIHRSKAIKVYVCNVMTQPGESESFTAAEHVLAISANVEHRVFDYVMVNTSTPSESTLRRYEEFSQSFVHPDMDRIREMGFKPVGGDFVNETDYVRHDPVRLADRLVALIYKK